MRPYDDVWGPEYSPGYDPNDTRSTYGGPASIPGTDEQGYINASPGVIAARTAAKENQQDAWNIRRAAIRQGIINYGGDLSGWEDKYHDIDAATRKAAAANQYSTLAQLARSLATNTRSMRQQLAARGMLSSGELGYGQNQLEVGYGQERANAARDLGDIFNQQLGTYTGVLGQNRRDIAGAITQAASDAMNDPTYHPHAAADYNAGVSSMYGKPVYSYTDANGETHYFNQDGSALEGLYG